MILIKRVCAGPVISSNCCYKLHPDVSKWKTAIHIINADGSGLHQLTDGTHTDFNQTWTRDGTNTPIWNRKNPETGGYQVMASKIGA